MSEKYRFDSPQGMYFMTLTIVGWVWSCRYFEGTFQRIVDVNDHYWALCDSRLQWDCNILKARDPLR